MLVSLPISKRTGTQPTLWGTETQQTAPANYYRHHNGQRNGARVAKRGQSGEILCNMSFKLGLEYEHESDRQREGGKGLPTKFRHLEA